jgi:hypothetical protein
MKSIISKAMALVVICVSLFSFTTKPGGEGFEIYLDNKLVMQRYGGDMTTIQNLHLNQSNSNGILAIKYYHCGKTGKSRTITIKDEQNKTLKEFHYTDVAKPLSVMNLPVNDIIGLKKGKNGTLKLFYSSSELPGGRVLASVTTNGGVSSRQ